jgi:uncharacterized delta-60 repeat protein
MNRKPLSRIISLVAKAAAPTTAVAASLAAPFAQAASGDLDPSFADHGRLGPVTQLKGSARAVEAPAEGGALIGGGIVENHCGWFYCYYNVEFEATNFVNALTEAGGIDASYDGAQAGNIEVVDIARQADGKVVATGRRIHSRSANVNHLMVFRLQADGKVVATGRRIHSRSANVNHLVVFRLEADGSLDTAFGIDGIVELDADVAADDRASALLVEPDGRIAIAGVRSGALTVLRLDPTGAIDASFGENGFFTGPAYDYDAGSRLARVSSGGYRVTTSRNGSCRILGLTAGGAVDLAYGHAGYANVGTGLGGQPACQSIAVQENDRLVVAGMDGDQAFAIRLLANGAPDSSFSAPEVAARIAEATAVAIADDGKILLGGDGISGATVMRLQASGQLDPLFGDAGATAIDLPSESGTWATVDDLAVRADGSVIAAGGAFGLSEVRPFAVRLLGDGGGDSAGILSIEQSYVDASESDEAVITVRRSGGRSGAVSVAYATGASNDQATAGQDYESGSGRLRWEDGETGERTIVVPVLADAGTVEEYEDFTISLKNPQGGVGLGARKAAVTIQPDGAPAGQFEIESYEPNAIEAGSVEVWLYRNFYYDGTVCVTLTAESGTAIAGEDFESVATQYCWGDQDSEAKVIRIPIVDDDEREATESFTVELSDATGGAVIGPRASTSLAILQNDQAQSGSGGGNGRGGGGGGAAGILSLLLLAFAEAWRSLRRRTWKAA